MISIHLLASHTAAVASALSIFGGQFQEPSGLSSRETGPVVLSQAIEQGDFTALEQARTAALPPEAAAIVDAQRAGSKLDFPSVFEALDRYASMADEDPVRQALAASIEADAAFTQGHYARVVRALERRADFATGSGDAEAVADLQQTLGVARLLAGTPRQSIVDGVAEPLQTTPDAAGLTRGPAEVNGHPIDMVVDTGANLSVLSLSAARRLGVRILEGDAAIGSSTQKEVAARLAVADRMRFGGLTFDNVVFIVLDDAQLSFPNGYSIDGIIGFPVFHATGGMSLSDDGVLTLAPPSRQAGGAEADLRINGNDLFAQVAVNGNPVSLHFDTGASATNLTALYAARHAPGLADAPRRPSMTGGAGGVVTGETATLANAAIDIGDARFVIPALDVEMSSEGRPVRWFGTLGQDILRRVDHYGLDLQRMKLVLGPDRTGLPRP